MTASEGRLIVRCFVTAVVVIVGVYALVFGHAELARAHLSKGLAAILIAAVCAAIVYLIREWERSKLVSGVTSDIDLAALRDDALSELSEEDLRILKGIMDDEAKRQALRKMKR